MNFSIFGGEWWKDSLQLCACHVLTRTALHLIRQPRREVVWIDYLFTLHDEQVEREAQQIVRLPCTAEVKYQYLVEQMKRYHLYSSGCNFHDILPFVEGWCGITRATYGRFSDEHCVAQCDLCVCLLFLGDVQHAENSVDWNWQPDSSLVRQFRDDVQCLCVLMGAQSVKPATRSSEGMQSVMRVVPLLELRKKAPHRFHELHSLLDNELSSEEALLALSVVMAAALPNVPSFLLEAKQCAKKLQRLSKRTKKATSRDALRSLENEASVCSARRKALYEQHTALCAAIKEIWCCYLRHFTQRGSCEPSVLFSVFFFILAWDREYPEFAVCGAPQLAPRFLSHTLFSVELCPLKVVSLLYALDVCRGHTEPPLPDSVFYCTFQQYFPVSDSSCTESCKSDLLQGSACWDQELDAKMRVFLETYDDYTPLCCEDD